MSVTVLATDVSIGDYPHPTRRITHEKANDYNLKDGMLFVVRVDENGSEDGIAVYARDHWFSAVLSEEETP